MKNKNQLPKGIKETEGGEVWVQEVVEQGRDESGRLYKKVAWRKLNEPLDLGSLKHPENELVLQIQCTCPQKKSDFSDILGGLFK